MSYSYEKLLQSSEDNDAELQEHWVYMAIHMKHQRLGCAYYDAYSQQLYVTQDMSVKQLTLMIATICQQVQPSIVLVSSAHINRPLVHALETQEQQVHIMARSTFHGPSAITRLLTLPWLSSISQLASILCLEDELMLACIHAILSYGNNILMSPANCLAVNVLAIQNIVQFTIENHVYISAITMRSLQVMIPSTRLMRSSTGTTTTAEHRTLLDLLDFTGTSAGYYKLKTWVSRPLFDRKILVMRYQAIEELLSPEHQSTVKELHYQLKHLGNMRTVLKVMHTKLDVNHWLCIHKFVMGCREISNLLSDWHASNSDSLIMQIRAALCFNSLNQLCHVVDTVLDAEATKQAGQFVVKLHVDKELDRLQHTYIGLEDFLQHIAKSLQMEWKPLLHDLIDYIKIAYFPYLGYLVAIPSQYTIPEDVLDELGLKQQFELETLIYFKCQQMTELDMHIGDVLGDITDIEIRIMTDLQEYIKQHRLLLLQAEEACATLDCLLSLSEAARIYRFTRPVISTYKNRLRIKQGWHPLYSMSTEGLINNDLNIPDKEQRVSLITGPNASGKTTFITQIALTVYMAHIGSFVPAKKAIIGLVDAIFACTLTMDSSSKSESAFMMDLQQMAMAVKHATPRSLIISDEFGQGTRHADGVALCAAVLHYFAIQEHGPIVMATTHFHEIYHAELLRYCPITHLTMKTIHSDGHMIYLYQIAAKDESISYALETAQQAELPIQIIENAKIVIASFQSEVSSIVQLNGVSTRLQDLIVQVMLKADFDHPTTDIFAFIEWIMRITSMTSNTLLY